MGSTLLRQEGIVELALSIRHEREYATDDRCHTTEISTRERSMVHDQIRAIVSEHGRLGIAVDELRDDASLYQAGLTSHASVNLMLAIEDAFGIEFPERMLRRRTFESIASIASAVDELTGGVTPAA
jgi:acyl carrier protein